MSKWIGMAPNACFSAQFPPPLDAREQISRILEDYLCARFGAVTRGVLWRWPRLPRIINFRVLDESIWVGWHPNRFKKGQWILTVASGDMDLPRFGGRVVIKKAFFVLDLFSIVSPPFSGEAAMPSDRPKAGQKSVFKNGAGAAAQGARTGSVEFLDFFTVARKSDRLASPVSRDLEVPATSVSPGNRPVRGLNPHVRGASL
jgi:hypothetical protein